MENIFLVQMTPAQYEAFQKAGLQCITSCQPIAWKIWQDDDIRSVMQDMDIEAYFDEQIIDEVVNEIRVNGELTVLGDCQDYEWDTIRDSIGCVLATKPVAGPIEWDTDDDGDADLPEYVLLPKDVDVDDDDAIADFLSDTYGFCVKGFGLNGIKRIKAAKNVASKKIKFSSAEAMLQEVLSGTDLYSPELEEYVFLYNDRDAIAVYSNISPDEAVKLAEKAGTGEDSEYWGAFLGAGGSIFDEKEDELSFCSNVYRDQWYDTRDISAAVAEYGTDAVETALKLEFTDYNVTFES